jgi:hypothetical protein
MLLVMPRAPYLPRTYLTGERYVTIGGMMYQYKYTWCTCVPEFFVSAFRRRLGLRCELFFFFRRIFESSNQESVVGLGIRFIRGDW